MSIFSKIMSWFRPSGSPEDEAEAEKIRTQRETIKVSQGGAYLPAGESGALPPTPDVTDPTK
jgi:hypothetical protein